MGFLRPPDALLQMRCPVESATSTSGETARRLQPLVSVVAFTLACFLQKLRHRLNPTMGVGRGTTAVCPSIPHRRAAFQRTGCMYERLGCSWKSFLGKGPGGNTGLSRFSRRNLWQIYTNSQRQKLLVCRQNDLSVQPPPAESAPAPRSRADQPDSGAPQSSSAAAPRERGRRQHLGCWRRQVTTSGDRVKCSPRAGAARSSRGAARRCRRT
jgi:hypothetical protein